MLRNGTQRTLARVRSASATQTPACAAATIKGRASARRKAVARLIGNLRSVDSSGAGLSRRPVASAVADVSCEPPLVDDIPAEDGKAGGRVRASWRFVGPVVGGSVVRGRGGVGAPRWPAAGCAAGVPEFGGT